jgi:hypothetical protein
LMGRLGGFVSRSLWILGRSETCLVDVWVHEIYRLNIQVVFEVGGFTFHSAHICNCVSLESRICRTNGL